MTLRLVASNDERPIAIRDHILPLLRQSGAVEVQRDVVRLTELRMDNWVFRMWTPFNELGDEEASSPGYRHAISRQRAQKSLPYGLDIWHNSLRVLRVLWSDDGAVDVVAFVRGEWEAEALGLSVAGDG